MSKKKTNILEWIGLSAILGIGAFICYGWIYENVALGAIMFCGIGACASQQRPQFKPPVRVVNIITLLSLLSLLHETLFVIFGIIGILLFAWGLYLPAGVSLCGSYDCNATERQVKESIAEAEAMRARGNYGLGRAPLPPGGYKLLKVHVKLKDGTFATYHSIALEHQLNAMLKSDPRIESYDFGVDDPAEYGRYGMY